MHRKRTKSIDKLLLNNIKHVTNSLYLRPSNKAWRSLSTLITVSREIRIQVYVYVYAKQQT